VVIKINQVSISNKQKTHESFILSFEIKKHMKVQKRREEYKSSWTQLLSQVDLVISKKEEEKGNGYTIL
jgi:hypothetical protein